MLSLGLTVPSLFDFAKLTSVLRFLAMAALVSVTLILLTCGMVVRPARSDIMASVKTRS